MPYCAFGRQFRVIFVISQIMSNHVIHVPIHTIHVAIYVIHVNIHAHWSTDVSWEAFPIKLRGVHGWYGSADSRNRNRGFYLGGWVGEKVL
jgi:hypothetical protein